MQGQPRYPGNLDRTFDAANRYTRCGSDGRPIALCRCSHEVLRVDVKWARTWNSVGLCAIVSGEDEGSKVIHLLQCLVFSDEERLTPGLCKHVGWSS